MIQLSSVVACLSARTIVGLLSLALAAGFLLAIFVAYRR